MTGGQSHVNLIVFSPAALADFYDGKIQKKRFVFSISYLNRPLFLNQTEEEFEYFDHPMGYLTIPCREDIFIEAITCSNQFRKQTKAWIKLKRAPPPPFY
ncbi:auxin-induced protein [Salix suchowensis]|nr:auxin-induced protein [Salix suchowensis]